MRLVGQRFTNGLYFYAEAAGGTILVKDRMRGRLYVKTTGGSGALIPIMNGSIHLTSQFNDDYQALAAENFAGVNKLCWFQRSTNEFSEWTLNGSWVFISGAVIGQKGSPAAYALEVAYQVDLDRDGIIGTP